MVSGSFTPARVRHALRTALAAAKAAGAQTALTGGTALEAWGISRATQDIDLVFLLDPPRLRHFQQLLQERGARFLEVRGDSRTAWLRILLDGIQIDWLRAWDRPTQRALRRAVTRTVLGLRLRVLLPEDLILLKLRVGRPRDLDDAARLYVFRAAKLDQQYLKRNVRRLHLSREWHYLTRTLDDSQNPRHFD